MKALYVRTPRRKFVRIGWICPKCQSISLDPDVNENRVELFGLLYW